MSESRIRRGMDMEHGAFEAGRGGGEKGKGNTVEVVVLLL